MPTACKRLITIVTALAFIFAMSVQAAPSAEALGLTPPTAADEHCPRMAVEHPERGIPNPKPCKGIMLDCVTQMGCIGSPSLARTAETQVAVSETAVLYWSPSQAPSRFYFEPELFPPIAG